jgi:hypothetical protein
MQTRFGPAMSGGRAGAEAKVFCFFFSKKKSLLP